MEKTIEIPEGYEARIEGNKVILERNESEDEKIRKFLVELVSNDKYNDYGGLYKEREVSYDDVLAYLERQKEQKPADLRDSRQIALMIENGLRSGVIEGRKQVVDNPEEYGLCKPAKWSEEDERKIDRIYEILGHTADDKGFLTSKRIIGDKEAIELQDFLKSLHPQPIPQPSTNHTIWHNASEEKPTKLPIIHIWYHGNRVNAVVAHENIGLQAELDDINFQPDDKWAYIEDLLNAQPHWKPSEEQMNALNSIILNGSFTYVGQVQDLISLKDELKKL